MTGLWRLTRNRFARRVYDRLAAVGVTATRMIEYEADLETTDAPGPSGADSRVSLTVVAPGERAERDLDVDFSIPVSCLDGEWVVVARTGDRPVGRALVSAGRSPYVEPLGERRTFDGAYVRRVYVARDWRNRGVAKRLVDAATAVASERLDEETAHALVAADNRPSRWVFESRGFCPVRRHDYVRLFGFERRRVNPVG